MDLRYPIGKFQRPAALSAEERARAIDEIAGLPAAIAAAVAGLNDSQLDTPYRPDGWTVRQVVHHVADSHMNALVRLKLAITEDNPTISPYRQPEWAALADTRLPVDVSLRLLDAVHLRWVTVLRSLEPAQFARTFQHPESGPQTIDSLVALYAWHGRHHTAHIASLRKREGW